MGWFSGSSKEEESAPTRENRKRCWETRDAYFACLDKAAVVKPGDEGTVCNADKKLYEENCAKSWIEYFNQRRVIADAQKDRLARGNEQMQASKK
ncbi:cytochrome oxidase c subunit VIb-domain-containing protein [Panaeolus papilionaceus]|nr:cytochrome oxidase c subunit VIb-domain-containing protein [Panaeolus papilionaceus]